MPSNEVFRYAVPEKYKHSTKIMPCRNCKRPMQVGIRTKKAPRCIECGIDAQAENARQMTAKAGPYYEKWIARMREQFGEGGTATPPPETTPPSDLKE